MRKGKRKRGQSYTRVMQWAIRKLFERSLAVSMDAYHLDVRPVGCAGEV